MPATLPTEGSPDLITMITIVDDRIRLTELSTTTHHIDLLHIDGRTWRLAETPRGATTYERWWDYPGGDPLPIVTAAYTWHSLHGCSTDTEPCGWVTRSTDPR
jgi:hypothetical protein